MSAFDRLPIARDDRVDPASPPCREETLNSPRLLGITETLGLHHHVIPGAGHITVEDGFGAWPAILGWCLDGIGDWASR
jgi:hypothetical protein